MSKMLAHAESVALKVFTQLYAYGEISTKEPQIVSNLNQSQQSFNWTYCIGTIADNKSHLSLFLKPTHTRNLPGACGISVYFS